MPAMDNAHALLIGIANYQHIRKLTPTVRKDARDIRNLLVDPNHCGYAPDNVEFTGYLLKDEYWNRLNSARAIIVLTTHHYSLLGGAMDGLYLEKPVIVSDQPTLREFSRRGRFSCQIRGMGCARESKKFSRTTRHTGMECANCGRRRKPSGTRVFRRLKRSSGRMHPDNASAQRTLRI